MGENQGMIWIILGVLVVAGAVILLGGAFRDSTEGATDKTKLAAATTAAECAAVSTELSEAGTTDFSTGVCVFTPTGS